MTFVRRPTRQQVTAGGGLLAILAFLPFWLPSLLSIGDFSLAFAWPFMLAAWALARPAKMSLGALVLGRTGGGLWIEGLCIGTAILFASLSMLVSPEPIRALRVILPMAYGLCVLVFMSRFSPLPARRTIYAMIYSGAGVTAIGIALAQAGSASVMGEYRLKGFFDNANQLGLVIIAFWPILLALLLRAQNARTRYLCLGAMLVLAYGLILSGAKTSMALAFASTCLICLYHAAAGRSVSRALVSTIVAAAVIALCIPLTLWVLSWASPITFDKVNRVFAGGLYEYQTIRSRNLLWEESIRIGLAHPLLGAGAGLSILGKTHSHNMALDYFRGTGLFGMAAAIALLITVATRTITFVVSTWSSGMGDRTRETIVAAAYLGALSYLVGNQISDSFSPSTAFAFWMVYIAAYVSTGQSVARGRTVRMAARASREPAAAPGLSPAPADWVPAAPATTVPGPA